MIAKIVKGSSFKGVVNYILDKEKDANILICDGLFAENKDTIAMSFDAQSKMNPKVTKPVGHISLAFHKEDEHRLTDRAMAGIALEYLKEMGITDTQVLIVRHFDKEHPHVHIAFNRIANNGRTISDRNERIRSARICKELTKKYNLYFASGKERVKQHRLKEPDKTKYELYIILKSEVSRCGNSGEVQGVVFTMNGYSFSGFKIDRRFSYSKIDAALERNRHNERQGIIASLHREEQSMLPSESRGNNDLFSGSIGLFTSGNTDGQAEENRFEEELKRRNKKKKQRKNKILNMDNNEVYALFEGIKNDLKGINSKLENTPKVSNDQSGGQPPAVDLTPIKAMFDSSAKEHQEQTKAMLTKFAEAEVYASNRILHLLRALKESFALSSEERDTEPQEHIHRHQFDIKSNKVFSLLVGMGIVCSLSFWGNIELWKSKRQYADDALKFRVIRSWGGCNANHILWLNDVFDIHRNEEAIEWIRQEADGYDRNLKTVSDSLMQEKLKVEEILK